MKFKRSCAHLVDDLEELVLCSVEQYISCGGVRGARAAVPRPRAVRLALSGAHS